MAVKLATVLTLCGATACIDFRAQRVVSGDIPALADSRPASDATDVQPSTSVSLSFNVAMDRPSFEVRCEPDAALQVLAWDDDDKSVVLLSMTGFLPATDYALILRGQSVGGRALAERRINFKTAAPATAPVLISTTPSNGAQNVATTAALTLVFDRAMRASSLDLSVTPELALPEAQWATDRKSVSFNGALWAAGTSYTIAIEASDDAGNALAAQSSLVFSTAAIQDETPPTVAFTFPADGAGVATNLSALAITFDDAMSSTFGSVTISGSGSPTCTPSWATDSQLICALSSDLVLNETYQVTVGTGFKDSNDNHLASAYVFSITASTGPDVTPPTLVKWGVTYAPDVPQTGENPWVNPPTAWPRGALRTGGSIQLEFSEPLKNLAGSGAPSPTVTLKRNGVATPVTVVSQAADKFALTWTSAVQPCDQLDFEIAPSVLDLFDNPISASPRLSGSVRIICESTSYDLAAEAAYDGFVYDGDLDVAHPEGSYAVGYYNSSGISFARGFTAFPMNFISQITRFIYGRVYIHQYACSAETPYATFGDMLMESVAENDGVLTESDYALPTRTNCDSQGQNCLSTVYIDADGNLPDGTGFLSKDVLLWVNDAWRDPKPLGHLPKTLYLRLRFVISSFPAAGIRRCLFHGAEDATYPPRLTVKFEHLGSAPTPAP